MKRIIVLMLFGVLFCRSVYSFSIVVGTNTITVPSAVTVANVAGENLGYLPTNSIRLNSTVTVKIDTSQDPPGTYTCQWSANIGNIPASGNPVTYTAPGTKGKATISVTVKDGANATVYTGSVSLLVYRSIFIIKNDDFDYCSWATSTNYLRPTWKQYTDYMESTHCKTNVGIICNNVPVSNSTWKTYINAMKSRGYVSYYCHGLNHENFTTFTEAQQLGLFVASDTNCVSGLGWHLDGFGAPNNYNNSSTTVAMNGMLPTMKFWLFYDMANNPPPFNGVNFSHGGTRLDAETGGFQIDFSTYFLPNYNSLGNRQLNVIQIHPPWWHNDYTDASGGKRNDLVEWDKCVGKLRADGNVMLSAMDYVMMVSTPHFVPDESANPDTTPPGNIASVYDGTVAGSDISTTNSATQLSANWTAATDTESGIGAYKYAIGTTAGGTNVANWTTVGNVTSVTKTGLSLTNGAAYYFSVKAVNGYGLESAQAKNSNGQTVTVSTGAGTDITPPTAPATVRDGTSSATDLVSTALTAALSANWDVATDGESAVTLYEYAIGTIPGGIDTKGWTSNGTILNVTASGLTLTPGTTYYFSVRATSTGGTGPARNSNGQYISTVSQVTPPVQTGSSGIYPNPFKFADGHMKFKVAGSASGELSIYTMSGKLVRKMADTGEINWDGRNDAGKKVARGIYLYILKDGNGTTNGKLSVVD